MTLTPGSEEIYAFVPLLEKYYKVKLNVSEKVTKPELVDYLNDSYFNNEYEINLASKVLSIGLWNYNPDTTDLFIYEVADVILLLTRGLDRFKHLDISCNLVTHIHELKAAGFKATLINDTVGQLPKLIKKNEFITRWFKKGEVIVINPTSTTPVMELLNAKAFIQFKKGYEMSDVNYANEYNEIYQLANIFEVKVYTAVTDTELRVLLNSIKNN